MTDSEKWNIKDIDGKKWGVVDKYGENSAKLWKTQNPKRIMFIGEYTYTLDEKKRLAIPVKFRTDLGKSGVITRGLDNCLFLFSKKEWLKLAEKLSQLPLSQSDARGFARIMLAGAMEVNLDKLGRILIPDYLKKYAFLKRKVVLAGLFTRIEIWDEENWIRYKQKTEKEAGDIAERLKELGI